MQSGSQLRKGMQKLDPLRRWINSMQQRWHHLVACGKFEKLTADQIMKWLKEGKQSQKCDYQYIEDGCTLNWPCKTCHDMHLTVLHEQFLNTSPWVYAFSLPARMFLWPTKYIRSGDAKGGHGSPTQYTIGTEKERNTPYWLMVREGVLCFLLQRLNLIHFPENLPLHTMDGD